jgi:sec-independent protein translocase protein TatA
MGLGTGEIILIIFVITIVFGAAKLPQLGDGLGRAIGSFKRALGGAKEIEASIKKPESDAHSQPEAHADAAPSTEKAK